MSSFRDAVNDSGLEFRRGLQALKPADARKITTRSTRTIAGSTDIDACLAGEFPNAPRWDYAVGFTKDSREKAFFVEVHPAASTNVKEIKQKLLWVTAWLKDKPLNNLEKSFHWVASGSVRIPRHAKQFKEAASLGLGGPAKTLVLR